MIIVTGGAGFIGSNLIKGLNDKAISDILVVDDLKDGRKFKNLVDLNFTDFIDKDDFLTLIQSDSKFAAKIQAIFHQGACSDTTEWDGKFMMQNNYHYSKILLHYALKSHIPFIYASSAAIYGAGKVFKEMPQYEKPLNVYGYSKFLFDQYNRRIMEISETQIVGLRYFNVYGPRECHKGPMASVAFHNHNQLLEKGVVRLFEGCDHYSDGEQRRDFVFVEDIVNVNLWFLERPEIKGIFNVGTGRSQPFNDVAKAIINWHNKGMIEYIPFPDHLKGRYQSFTEADISALRAVGYTQNFKTVEEGIKLYLDWLAMSD